MSGLDGQLRRTDQIDPTQLNRPDLFSYEILASDSGSRARAGRFWTAHGPIDTPAFMPVGTQATVKTVDPAELHAVGAQIILANTYHLALRPGSELVERFGGLHNFMHWDGPILTDSGGFQIWSLAQRTRGQPLVKIDEDGVTFRSHLDGSLRRFTPESAIDVQAQLGADVVMAFDECTPKDTSVEYAWAAAERTERWARRCRDRWGENRARNATSQALFGIIQGGAFRDVRRWSAEATVALNLPGIAIGGESIGYSKEQTTDILEWIGDVMPTDRPRYAMGVGDPADFLAVIERGVDLFDSVLPTRLARNGALLTRQGRLRIVGAAFRDDEGPIDSDCRCLACQQFTRAYIHHLFRARELLGHRLATLHNLTYCLDLVGEIRAALQAGTLSQLRQRWSAARDNPDQSTGTSVASRRV